MVTTLQQQARALGDPTRHRIFRYLAEAPAPVGVTELTEYVGLNHNAVRQHLAKLVDAQLVVETRVAPSGRGRPPLHYSVHPGADGRWGDTGPYERLAEWLAEVVRTGDTAQEVGRRTGLRRRQGLDPTGDPVGDLAREMARLGFEPTIDRDGTTAQITLGNCPFAATASADPGTVCSLHLGMAQGLAEGIGGIRVTGLTVEDPSGAGCRLQVQDQGR